MDLERINDPQPPEQTYEYAKEWNRVALNLVRAILEKVDVFEVEQVAVDVDGRAFGHAFFELDDEQRAGLKPFEKYLGAFWHREFSLHEVLIAAKFAAYVPPPPAEASAPDAAAEEKPLTKVKIRGDKPEVRWRGDERREDDSDDDESDHEPFIPPRNPDIRATNLAHDELSSSTNPAYYEESSSTSLTESQFRAGLSESHSTSLGAIPKRALGGRGRAAKRNHNLSNNASLESK